MGVMSGIDDKPDTMPVKSPEEMKAEIQGKEPTPEQETAKYDDPRLAEEYTFDVRHKDVRGKVWEGKFTNRILSFTQISQVGALKGRMTGGVPFESVDDYTLDHNEKVAHCTVSLLKRPKWAADFGDLRDKKLLDLIYLEVARHEATFSGREPAEETDPSRVGDVEGEAPKLVEQ